MIGCLWFFSVQCERGIREAGGRAIGWKVRGQRQHFRHDIMKTECVIVKSGIINDTIKLWSLGENKSTPLKRAFQNKTSYLFMLDMEHVGFPRLQLQWLADVSCHSALKSVRGHLRSLTCKSFMSWHGVSYSNISSTSASRLGRKCSGLLGLWGPAQDPAERLGHWDVFALTLVLPFHGVRTKRL